MTSTDLVNLSLLKINEASIEDIEDTGDPIARKALTLYEPTLREVLKAGFWTFATVCRSLTPSIWSKSITTTGEFTILGDTVTIPELYYAGQTNSRPAFSETGDLTTGNTNLYWNSTAWIFEYNTTGEGFSSSENVASPELVTSWTPTGDMLGTPTLTLAVSTTRPDMVQFLSAFLLPSDFLKLRRLIDPTTSDPIDAFAIRRIGSATHLLAADFASIIIEYTAFVDDPDVYDPLFTQAFTTLLAARLARSVTGSEKMEADLLAAYHQLTLPDARTADAQETQSAENHPLKDLLAGSLTGRRGSWFDESTDTTSP